MGTITLGGRGQATMAAKRIFNGVLTADTVLHLTTDRDYTTARVLSMDGAAPIYIRGDGVDPVDPFDDCEALPAAIGFVVVRLSDRGEPSTLKLRSPGTPAYSIKFS